MGGEHTRSWQSSSRWVCAMGKDRSALKVMLGRALQGMWVCFNEHVDLRRRGIRVCCGGHVSLR